MSPRRTMAVAAAAWGFGLLALPAAAYVAGARQPNLEARPKTPFPAINRSSLPNPQTFARLDSAILDRLPLRQDALQARGRIAVQLFHQSTNRDVLLGTDGWLFYEPTLATCDWRATPPSDPAAVVEIIARTLVASGRRTGVVIAPSKMVSNAERVRGADPAKLACVVQLETKAQQRLATTPGGIDLVPELDRLRETSGPVFRERDTHWNGYGQLAYAREVLDVIEPGLADAAGVRRLERPIKQQGDLSRFLGVPWPDTWQPIYAARRPARLPDLSRVVLIGDSQTANTFYVAHGGQPPVADVALPGATFCAFDDFNAGACDEAVRRSKTIVVERVGRSMNDTARGCWRFLSLTGTDLRGPRAAWRPSTGAAVDDRGDLTVGETSYADLLPRAKDVAPYPRLFRIPVRRIGAATAGQAGQITMIQQPRSGPETPCATPGATKAGEAMLFPVAAGRPLSQLGLAFKAPPGTVLGRPEEISLADDALPAPAG